MQNKIIKTIKKLIGILLPIGFFVFVDFAYSNAISSNTNIVIKAGDTVKIHQGDINSSNGLIAMKGDNDVDITEGRSKSHVKGASYSKDRGFLSSTKRIHRYDNQDDLAVSSNITGKKVIIHSGDNADISIRGSNVVSDNGTQLQAGKNVVIEAAENYSNHNEFNYKKKSGLFGTGGLGFTIGSQKQSSDSKNTQVTHTASMVGSVKAGDTTIIAGEKYTQKGSTVTAVDGDVNVLAKQIAVTNTVNTATTDTKNKFKQSGLTVSLSVPVVDMVTGLADTVQTVGKSKNSRVNAMALANTAMQGFEAGKAIQGLSDNLQKAKELSDVKDAMGISLSVSLGSQKSQSSSHTEGSQVVASAIKGKNVNLVATGGDKSSITVQGSDVAGTDSTSLTADHDVTLLAADGSSLERSNNTSSGGSIGLKISATGEFGVSLAGNKGKGYGNGDSVTHRNTYIGSTTGKTTIQAGNTLTLKGAQAIGKGVKVRAKDLDIESLQDSATYKGKQKNIGGSITIGAGVSGSANYSKSKINADHLSVKEQSGIFAGDDGFDVKVENHTDLKGGIITSTAKAEADGNNIFSTGTITKSDLQNHSEYDASGFAIGGGITLGGNNKKENDNKFTDIEKLEKNKVNAFSQGKIGINNKSIGYGKDSDSQSNITQSGIGTDNIIITDKTNPISAEQIKTTKTTEQVLVDSGLQNRFDKDEVQSEIDLQVKVTKQLDINRQKLKKDLLDTARGYFTKAREIRKKNGGVETQRSLEQEEKGHKLSKTVSYIDTALGVLWGSADGLGLATKQVVAQHADYAKNAATHITAGQVYKIDCSGKAAQYYCKDNEGVKDVIDGKTDKINKNKKDDPQWEGGAREIYDVSELEKNKDKGNIIISNPGIFNSKSDAFRNAVKQNPEAAKNGNLYVVINNPTYETIPFLAELMYAGYDKFNDKLGAVLPLTNAEKANVNINAHAKEKGFKVEKSNHSRGGLTESVSLQRTNNIGIKNVPIVESRFFGTATNVEDYLKQIRKNGYDKTKVKQATHKADFVGRPPLILGGNPATGGDCWFCYSHSSYYGEVPEPFLKDKNDKIILDKNGKKIKNPEYEKYTKIWGEPTEENKSNLSLPKEVILENNKMKFKEK